MARRTKKRRLGKEGRSCPPHEVVCKKAGDDYIRCEVRLTGGRRTQIGELDLLFEGDLAKVGGVMVDPDYQRCGVGTKLYEKALKVACSHGKRLASDVMRTQYSEGFWSKQVRKGRASCIEEGRGAKQIKWDEDAGDEMPRWQCRQYAMNETCPSSGDLSGYAKARNGAWR